MDLGDFEVHPLGSAQALEQLAQSREEVFRLQKAIDFLENKHRAELQRAHELRDSAAALADQRRVEIERLRADAEKCYSIATEGSHPLVAETVRRQPLANLVAVASRNVRVLDDENQKLRADLAQCDRELESACQQIRDANDVLNEQREEALDAAIEACRAVPRSPPGIGFDYADFVSAIEKLKRSEKDRDVAELAPLLVRSGE